ncbi:MAG: SufB/SufD family protein [Acidimicrobiales bacterium]
MDLPTETDEHWRYSGITEFDLGRFTPAEAGDRAQARRGTATQALPEVAVALLDRHPARSGLVVTRNGVLESVEVSAEATKAGVVLADFAAHDLAAELLSSVASHFTAEGEDAYGALADSCAPGGPLLHVPAGCELGAPVLILHVLEGPGYGAYFPRSLVRLGENAGATVVELLVSGDEPAAVFPTVELSVAEGARLTHEVVQLLGSQTWQFGRIFASAGRDATLQSFQASLGAKLARTDTKSVLTGQGGTAKLLAAYFGAEDQVHDFRILQEHAAPRTTSDLVFKGAVGGTARSVYTGLIRMRKGARGATAFQTNRNLVLSDGAHADSVPNLDIQENDVRCSHASAVGPIDEEQRFYVESRGVPADVAERLILVGFFVELLERVSLPVHDLVIESIAGRLAAAR